MRESTFLLQQAVGAWSLVGTPGDVIRHPSLCGRLLASPHRGDGQFLLAKMATRLQDIAALPDLRGWPLYLMQDLLVFRLHCEASLYLLETRETQLLIMETVRLYSQQSEHLPTVLQAALGKAYLQDVGCIELFQAAINLCELQWPDSLIQLLDTIWCHEEIIGSYRVYDLMEGTIAKLPEWELYVGRFTETRDQIYHMMDNLEFLEGSLH